MSLASLAGENQSARFLSMPREQIGWSVFAVGIAALALLPLTAAWSLASDLGHGWGAPLLAGYLYWERWQERPKARPFPVGWLGWSMCFAVLLAAAPLRLLLTPYPLWPAILAAYTLLLAAVALVSAWLRSGSSGLLWVGGPLLVFLGTLPWPGHVEHSLVTPLREVMATIAAELSNALGQPAVAAGTSVRLGPGWVGIDEACGGMRSLQASLMVALFLGEWFRLGWPWRVALVSTGAVAAVLGNFLRVLFLVWRADGGAAALQASHDAAGWIALGTSMGLTGAAAWLMRRRKSDSKLHTHPEAGHRPDSSTSLRWAFVMLSLLCACEAGTRLWFARGARVLRAPGPQWTAVLPANAGSFHPLPLGKEATDMLRPDYYTAGRWTGHDGRKRSAYFVEWKQGQAARSIPFLHNPTVCLPASGCQLARELGDISVPWLGGSLLFHAYVFRSMSEEFAVAFIIWDPLLGQPLRKGGGDGWLAWWRAQWSDVKNARQHQQAQLLTLAIHGEGSESLLSEELAALVRRRN